jgi:hypothetical protein
LGLFLYRLHKKIADMSAFVKKKVNFYSDFGINEKTNLSLYRVG